MPLKELTPDLGTKSLRRVLIIGAPGTFKTTSIIKSFPRPLAILNYPGEGGSAVIPTNEPDLKAWAWEQDPHDFASAKIIDEVEQQTWKILMSGEFKTFAGDGLTKLAALYWNREYQRLLNSYAKQIAEGKVNRDGVPYEEGLKLQAYGNENYGACRDTLRYISRIRHSNIDTVVLTTREGVEAEDKELVGNTNRHIFAELPGKLARNIVGEFGVVMRAEVSNVVDPKTGATRSEGVWQIRKGGSVWGVGVKVSPERAEKLPLKVPQDWGRLYQLLTQ